MRQTFPEKPDAVVVTICPGVVHTTVNYDAEEQADGTWSAESVTVETAGKATAEDIIAAIASDIDTRTDAKILTGFVWEGKSVWLSAENQRNFSEAQRVAMMTEGASLPVTFKIGEDAQHAPVYHAFTTVEELTGFFLQGVAFINTTLNEGWREKDAMREWVKTLDL